MTWSKDRPATNSPEHKKWKRAVLRKARGRCELQIVDECTGVAVVADHKRSVAEGGDPLDPANGQGVCEPCHTAKTRAETARGRARYYGQARRAPERHPGLP